jgi:sulfur-oxidizing protein SoxY
MDDTTRREILLAGGAAVLAVTLRSAEATPAMLASAIRTIVGTASVKTGKVKLDIPPLVENGNTVPCTVTVDSPLTAADHVKAIHVFAERNPQPYVFSIQLGPRAGRASISTRIRLRDTQNVLAIAELSDGTFWSDRVNVIVTIGACLEDVL